MENSVVYYKKPKTSFVNTGSSSKINYKGTNTVQPHTMVQKGPTPVSHNMLGTGKPSTIVNYGNTTTQTANKTANQPPKGYGIGFGNTGPKHVYTDKNEEINRTLQVIQNRTNAGMDLTHQYAHYKNLTGKDYQAKPAGFDQDSYLKQMQDQVNSIYDQQRQAQLSQFYAERDKALGLINQQKAEVAPQYASKRNQADVVNAQNVQRLRETMAANGISSSGENVTANVGLQSARQGAIADLNLQEQQTNNDFNRQIMDINDPDRVNAIVAQLEAQRAQAMYDATNRADEVGYSRGRDVVMDGRYADETQYNRSQNQKQWDYQVGRDKVGDSQWNQQWNYQKGRDAVGDARWNQEYQQGNQRYADEKAWREYTYKNMSAADKAQMSQNASQFGEEMAWRMYNMEYQGELDKSMSQAEIEAYKNGNFNKGTGGYLSQEELGSLSRKYESSGNPATIARTKGDQGGASYGTYQLTTNSGHAQSFANSYGGALKGLKAGSKAFDNAWQAEAKKNPKAFANAQHNYIQRNHYEPAASRFQSITGINLDNMPKSVKDMIWSIGVQHGAGGAASIFKNAGITAGMNAASIIKKVYNERMKVDKYFSSSPQKIKNSVYNRFKQELNDALNMLR